MRRLVIDLVGFLYICYAHGRAHHPPPPPTQPNSVFLLYLNGGAGAEAETAGEGAAKFQRMAAAVLAVGSLCSLAFVAVVSRHAARLHAREHGLGLGLPYPPAASASSLSCGEAPPPSRAPTEGSSSSGSSSSCSGGNGGSTPGAGPRMEQQGQQQQGPASASASASYETFAALMPGGTTLQHHDSVLRPVVARWPDWFKVPDFYW